jgi:tripartite-type tricarboxylate transporter receptor subunit TctC
MDRRIFLAGAGATASAFMVRGAKAMASSMKILYPYAPGSGGDILARLLADDMSKKLGITAIVENKTGASGRIGVRDVKYSRPDGSELLFTPFGTMVLFPSVFENLSYDAFKDFRPVTQVVTYDFGLAVGPKAKVKNLDELVAWLKKNPDKGNLAVPGLGALPHLLPLKFSIDTQTKIQAIAYRGTEPALTAAMSGQVALVSRL